MSGKLQESDKNKNPSFVCQQDILLNHVDILIC